MTDKLQEENSSKLSVHIHVILCNELCICYAYCVMSKKEEFFKNIHEPPFSHKNTI